MIPEAGSKFYSQIVECMENSDNIIVDMSEVTALLSVFLNASIGRHRSHAFAQAQRGEDMLTCSFYPKASFAVDR